MAGYYSRPAQLARQMRQLLFPRRCPCCRRVLGTLPREMKDQIIKLLDDWKGQQKEHEKPEKKNEQEK